MIRGQKFAGSSKPKYKSGCVASDLSSIMLLSSLLTWNLLLNTLLAIWEAILYFTMVFCLILNLIFNQGQGC